MKRATILFFCALFFSAHVTAATITKDNWVKVTSKHFTLVGNASEKDIRTVGTKLEQFRQVFSQLFPRVNVNSAVPITVIVFKSKSAYTPFMPVRNGKISEVGGYFQPGQDINYITLTSEFSGDNPYTVIFHEFVHSLTNQTTANMPLWFTEGIAEFYGMFEVLDKDTKVQLGAPISHHILRLRETKLMPFSQLFAVNHNSPDYNERDKKGIFYAESWALVHYLMLGNNQTRRPQLMQFINLLNTGAPLEECFTKAFQTDFATLENEVKNYIGKSSYPVLQYTSKEKLTFDDQMSATPIGDAESNYYLGDLLAHQRRTDAEKFLQTAIQLDPTLAPAHASLGMIRVRAGNFAEAEKFLEKAVTYDKAGKNHLIYFYYAQALLQQGSAAGERQIIMQELNPQRAALVRTNLQRTIAIQPTFAHAYSLLAFLNLMTGADLTETVAMLKRATQFAPGDENLAFQLAQVYVRQQQPDEAKKILEPLARNSPNPQMKSNAQSQLEVIQRIQENLAKFKADQEAYEKQQQSAVRESQTPPPSQVESTNSPMRPMRPTMRRRHDGEDVRGVLTKMDCAATGTILHVMVGNEKLMFTSQPNQLEFISFTQGVGDSIECGEFKPAKPVRIIYRNNADTKSKYKGEAITVEFIKPDSQ